MHPVGGGTELGWGLRRSGHGAAARGGFCLQWPHVPRVWPIRGPRERLRRRDGKGVPGCLYHLFRHNSAAVGKPLQAAKRGPRCLAIHTGPRTAAHVSVPHGISSLRQGIPWRDRKRTSRPPLMLWLPNREVFNRRSNPLFFEGSSVQFVGQP